MKCKLCYEFMSDEDDVLKEHPGSNICNKCILNYILKKRM